MNTTNEPTSPAIDCPLKNTTSVPEATAEKPLLTPPLSSGEEQREHASGHHDRHQNIARLPKETRDMINVMLEDGLPYHVLIDELGEAGHGLNIQSLAEWVQGRYQIYLKDRDTIEHIKSRKEFASDLLRELGEVEPSVIYRACRVVAALQILEAILEHGDEALSQMLHTRPANYVSLLNGLCNISNAENKTGQPSAVT